MLKNNGFHNRHSPFSRPFSPASFFANGEQGWWYDPSNFATLFQDSAGTTPVTAVEQPVGLQLDLSGRGNHRFQSTSANRPVVSARVNLLTKTEQFEDAVWTKSSIKAFGSGSVANEAIAPNGTLTADYIQLSATTGSHYVLQTFSTSALVSHKIACYFKRKNTETRYGFIYTNTGVDRNFIVDLTNGAVTLNTFVETPVVTALPNGWYSAEVTFVSRNASTTDFLIGFTGSSSSIVFTASGTEGGYIWGADGRPTNQGVGLPAYQRVNTSTDYDSVGFPIYIKPNGSNQFMQTNSINFTATDKMTLWQGVRKLSDASIQMLYELSDNSNANNGVFNSVPGYSGIGSGVGAYWNISSKGTIAQAAVTAATFPAPATAVQSQQSDISGDRVTLRINGAQVAQNTSDQGTGNFGTYPTYFYSRAGSTLYFSGNDYGSIARGAASTAAQITNGETYINSLTKAFA